MELARLVADGCLITPWEAILYAVVITLLAFNGMRESCLVNTFSFSYYWGFKSLIETLAITDSRSQVFIAFYVIFGFSMFGLVNFHYFKKQRAIAQPT
ncbi:MAG: hypothetical protein HYY46_01845 [Deltaproteobacteria bacterium]|nr:hypothetical protein [Deltaproteobacteria bacterium]